MGNPAVVKSTDGRLLGAWVPLLVAVASALQRLMSFRRAKVAPPHEGCVCPSVDIPFLEALQGEGKRRLC